MTDSTVKKIEAQTSKKVKGAKAIRTSNVSKINATITRARRKFQQQLKKNQNLQTKIECIEEVAEEVYGSSSAQMVWHDLLKESKRLTNLVDFNEYCKKVRHVCKLANIFKTKKIRMFSFFKAYDEEEKVFAYLREMVKIGKEYGVGMCHENEMERYTLVAQNHYCIFRDRQPCCRNAGNIADV